MEISQNNLNYNRIAKAIAYIKDNFQAQPSLDEIAAHIHVSPFHFQRMFQDWAGTSPKKFLQYISLAHAKSILKASQSLADATYKTGLSSSSRLHELFVQIEAMTPAEYKIGGKNLKIYFSFHETPFGEVIIASTSKGICHIAFIENQELGLKYLKNLFPNAEFYEMANVNHEQVLTLFNHTLQLEQPIKLHLKGTSFQLKVWEALLKIPSGNLQTYGNIAKSIGKEKASRAVGTAIGSNPIAYLIPCHRVIQSTGIFGGYMWDPIRKTAIIGWENAQQENQITTITI